VSITSSLSCKAIIEKHMCNFINIIIMNKKLFYGIAVFALAALAVWNLNFGSQMKGMSDVSLANVEALAGGEDDGITCLAYCQFSHPDYDCIVSIGGGYYVICYRRCGAPVAWL
jgi:hypothetical protein